MKYQLPVIISATASTILSESHYNVVIALLVVVQLTTMNSCYLIAVSLGHVKPWLPMISDCGCKIPETWIFRIGFICIAGFMATGSTMFRDFTKYQLQLSGINTGRLHFTNNILVYICGVSCFALAGLSSVNEDENSKLHGIFAVTFFLLYLVYMIALVVFLHTNHVLVKIKPFSLFIKEIVVFFCTVDLIAFAIMSSHWGKYALYLAITEWLAVYFILIFNITFYWEFKNGYCVANIFQPKVYQALN